MKRRGEKILKPVRPNAGIEAEYRARLDRLIADMTRSYLHWIRAQYRQTPPMIAQDATPAKELEREIASLGRQWTKNWNKAADQLADWFARSTKARSEKTLHRILKEAGISVQFKMTPTVKDIFEATVSENVGLIKSIPEQYHTQVQGMVMRSVTTGRDLEQLTNDLAKRYRLTRKRAAFIARDQNNKSTAVITRARQEEAGIDEAIWLHSHGGKTPRPTHLANDGKRYKVSEGWYDPAVKEYIWPGTLPNCRCVAKPVVKGFA
jgi:SPP1 gp7 family putative phage head morphogenesis protein